MSYGLPYEGSYRDRFNRDAQVIEIEDIQDAYRAFHHAVLRHGERIGYGMVALGRPAILVRLHDGTKAKIPLPTLSECDDSFQR